MYLKNWDFKLIVMLLSRTRVSRILAVFVLAISVSMTTYAQPKGITAQMIQEFIEFIEENAMPMDVYLENSKDLSTFVKVLKLTGDFDKLKNNDEYTVFAPTNQAFEQFPVEVITELFQPRNIEKLKSIAAYHIIESRLRSSTIVADIDENNGLLATYKMLNGLEITAFYDEETIFIKDANGYPIEVLKQDILLSNGLVYKIDTVILPQVDNERQLAENN